MQEFSVFEHYAAYWNFEDNMQFTEDMFDYIFANLDLEKNVKIKDKQGETKLVDFQTPWQRIDYIQAVSAASGIDINAYQASDEDALRADIKAAGHAWE